MKLLTEEIKKQLPPIGSQDGKGHDAVAVVKFFTPTSSFTWYASEGGQEEDDFLFFGLVTSHMCPEGELGYFSLNELSSVKGPLGLGVERDLHWDPKPLSLCHRAR
jgi:hypothetical protein